MTRPSCIIIEIEKNKKQEGKIMNLNNTLKVITQTQNVNIFFEKEPVEIVFKNFQKNVPTLIYHAKTILPDNSEYPFCKKCNCYMIRHGYSAPIKVRYTTDNASRHTIILLKKARFICKKCRQTVQINATSLVPKNCSISNRVRQLILSELTTTYSMKEIAKHTVTSPSFVLNLLIKNVDPYTYSNRFSLPEHLCIDEVRVVNKTCGFICCNAENGRIIGALPTHDNATIKAFFSNFSVSARDKVKSVTMDLNVGYPSAIREMFRNAELIADRFHLVKMLNDALNKMRVAVYKKYRKDTIEYKILKNFHKLFECNISKLDGKVLKKRTKLFNMMLTDVEIVDMGLQSDKELARMYDLVQNVTQYLRDFDALNMEKLLKKHTLFKAELTLKRRDWTLKNNPKNQKNLDYPKELQENEVQAKLSTFCKPSFYDAVLNAFAVNYSTYTNGRIEGINNVVKLLKRNAFGFRVFDVFYRRLILRVNNCI